MLLERINHDMPRIQNDMFKDVDRERKMEEKKWRIRFYAKQVRLADRRNMKLRENDKR